MLEEHEIRGGRGGVNRKSGRLGSRRRRRREM